MAALPPSLLLCLCLCLCLAFSPSPCADSTGTHASARAHARAELPELPGCPCSDPSLCLPLSPIPHPRDEVVAFPASQIYGAGFNGTEEKLYDWGKITTIAPFEGLGRGPTFQALYCDAHAHGVKVLAWSEDAWNGRNCNVTQLYVWARSNDPHVYDQAVVQAWASAAAQCLVEAGFDGVMLDMEGAYTVGQPKLRAAVTAGVCALHEAVTQALPGAVVYWTVDTGNYFDYGAMTKRGCVDLWLDMDYCLCTSAAGSRANAMLARVNYTAQAFASYGVPAERLGVIFPWFGCDFVCDSPNCSTVQATPKRERILPGDSNVDNTTDDGDGPGIGEVMQLMPNMTSSGVQLSLAPDYTKHFNWRSGNGELHQVWYDDAETLAVKMAAAKKIGIRAVGMWTSDATRWNKTLAAEMWGAVPAPNKSQAPL